MAQPARKSARKQVFTYADYKLWPDGERWELIDGAAFKMSPAPAVRHTDLAFRLAVLLDRHFADKPCRVHVAPTDVLLLDLDETDPDAATTTVQPDVFVVCDRDKVKPAYVLGAPDLCVEVLSPSTAKKDAQTKRDRYARAGVREYWLVDPELKLVTRYALRDGNYGLPDVFGAGDTMPSTAFPELTVGLDEVFAEA